jgi:tRNA modification GTPase
MAFHGNSHWHPEDTIVAISSATGPALRGIVRLSGSRAFPIVEQLFSSEHPRRSNYLTPGFLKLAELHSPLPADLYCWAKPNTYTGQDLVELHTIGSVPLLERLVAELLRLGARMAQPGEFTLRAFLAGKKDLTQAEAVLGIIEANTTDDLQASLEQLAGGVSQPLAKLRDDLLNLLADVEAGLDFVEEDIQFVSDSDLLTRLSAGLAHLINLRRQLDTRTVSGRALRVAIVGRPNAGKSSLFNALLGREAAIISEQAGTTRDYLTVPVEWSGLSVELIDTAGWQDITDTIEEQAQRLGRQEASRADVLLWCVPAAEEIPKFDELQWSGIRGVQLLRTKSDQLASGGSQSPETWFCSVHAPESMVQLRMQIIQHLQELSKPSLAPSQSRCRGHVEQAMQALRRAHAHVLEQDPAELLALAIREAIEQLGQLTGAVYTNDLLDRIFSRFCIGK